MQKVKELTQAEKDAKTSFWFMNAKQAEKILAKIHSEKIKINCYIENNMLILNRNFTKTEYKLIFPMVKSDLL